MTMKQSKHLKKVHFGVLMTFPSCYESDSYSFSSNEWLILVKHSNMATCVLEAAGCAEVRFLSSMTELYAGFSKAS